MFNFQGLLPAVLLFFTMTGFAAQPYTPEVADPLSESWRWRHFPEIEGKGVRCIVEDRNGHVWFGVNDGVIEYDGYTWNWHTSETGLEGSPVERLYAGQTGAIYATTPKGLFAYQANRWQKILSLDSSVSITFHQIRELSNGLLLICTQLGMLEIKPDMTYRVYTSSANRTVLAGFLQPKDWILLPAPALSEGTFLDISDILEVRPGLLWMSITLQGYSRIIQFEPDAVRNGTIAPYTLITHEGAPPFGETQKMLRTSDHSIWLINNSTNIGIHKYDGKHWEYLELSDLFGGDEYATDIIQSADGTIWIGALGKLYTYKNDRWQLYKSPDFMIPANRLLLTPSRQNSIWIGGHKSKIYRLDLSSSRWITYKNLNFQCESTRDEQWFLDVQGRVIRRVGNSWTAYDARDGLMDAPTRLIVTSKGQVWAAGSHEGVAATALFDDGRWRRQLHPQLSWGIDYRAVFEAKDGSLWFGGGVDFVRSKGQMGGVLQLVNPTAESWNWIHHKYHENGLLQSNAYGIGQSPDGRIWIGGGSLYYFDGAQWNRSEKEPLRQFVNIVHSTDQLLLVGSRYYGIFLYDGKNWQQFDTDSGLSSNTIISLYDSPDGQVWVATENDIARFDGSRWVNHVFPSEMNLSLEGGSIAQSSDGAIWINKSSREWNRRGFSYSKTREEMYRNFVAYRYLPDQSPPETNITLYSPEVSPEGNTLMSWTGEDFLGETPDNRLYFSYRLNGGAWSPFSLETHHTFVNLASGRYTLEVRARDLDFNVDPTPAVVEFFVQPPVWKQTWFLALLFAFSLVIGIFEYRIITKKQKLEKLNKSLNTLNQELKTINGQVVQQQQHILVQNQELERSYHNLELRNQEIQYQRDKLEAMVTQVEELSKSKVNFFTNISHELRTPLTLILGPLEQLQNVDHPVPAAERSRLLEIIERNAYRLLKLINQLLEMRRIETNTLELHLFRSNLGQFLSEITGLFDNLARETHIHLSFHNHCTNAMVAFDPDKIEKIMVNLLSNAFKHTPEGGRIAVALEQETEGFFTITVEDTGEGICPEELRHIFERYYSAREDHLSSGIGLAYIKELIELHQGRIAVESQEGKGTVFTVYIPAGLDAGRPAEKRPIQPERLATTNWEVRQLLDLHNRSYDGPPPLPPDAEAPRILIVDDNDDMVTFLKGMLSRKYQIWTARNGEEGLRIAQNHPLDLVLSDVMMPEMNGLEFCNRLKSDFATSHLPVILLTAKNMDEHIMEGYTTGADDYMTKPFNPDLLSVRIDNLLQQRQQLRQKFNRDFALQPKEVELTSPDEELLQRLVEIMEEHIADSDFNVNKMCRMVHLSHMHFIRKVKQLTGKKPIDLLKSYRLKRAKDLLRQNKANIAEVAYMVGYDLPNSFSRAFKKEFGLSPTEYLESMELPSASVGVDGSKVE